MPKFLKSYEEFGGLGINWQLFGTSCIEHIPEDKTVIGTLLKKAPRLFSTNSHVKSIVQPKCIKKYIDNSHFPLYKKNCISVTERKSRFKGARIRFITTRKIWLNHYIYRDEDFFYNVKCARIAGLGKRY